MTVEVKQALWAQKIIDPQTGNLTLDGLEIMQRLILAVQEQQTTTADHETRIVALEP
jgi:hypothetical protein